MDIEDFVVNLTEPDLSEKQPDLSEKQMYFCRIGYLPLKVKFNRYLQFLIWYL